MADFHGRRSVKVVVGGMFLVWSALVFSALFIFQKPVILQVISGLGYLAGTLFLWILMLSCAALLGSSLSIIPKTSLVERLLLGTGLGLGVLGLLGFSLAALGVAYPPLLLGLLVLLLVWQSWRGGAYQVGEAARELFSMLATPAGQPGWMPAMAVVALALTFLQALAPPADGFDSLFYHLPVPLMWLRDGGLRVMDMSPYWYPSLAQGMFVWPLALGYDVVTQLLHWAFVVLIALLLWFWVFSISGGKTAWWAVVLLLTMPALLWLATWAYSDFVLSFFTLGALYTLWRWRDSEDARWLRVTALMAGFAMGIKYTSFVLPVFVVLFIFSRCFTNKTRWIEAVRNAAQFSVLALLVASPWYVRNWVWMQNPFYPFAFGGLFRDSFRSTWYYAAGTGISWDIFELLLVPWNLTLGHREAFNYSDGKIGPLFLILTPVLVWTIWKIKAKASPGERSAFLIVILFFAVSAAFWVAGVMNTASLWQARLLFPGLFPMVMPMAYAIQEIRRLDSDKLRISFIFSTLVIFFVIFTLLDFGLLVLNRNPLAVVVGMESRQEYLQRIQPEYAGALNLVEKLPPDANVYFLFEARSYGMKSNVFVDTANDNLAYALYRFRSAENVIGMWKQGGYTHVLICYRGLDILRDSKPTLEPFMWVELKRLVDFLHIVGSSSGGDYVLYSIP